jgi:hypothetical protein
MRSTSFLWAVYRSLLLDCATKFVRLSDEMAPAKGWVTWGFNAEHFWA